MGRKILEYKLRVLGYNDDLGLGYNLLGYLGLKAGWGKHSMFQVLDFDSCMQCKTWVDKTCVGMIYYSLINH